jgi:peroxiredoxin
MLRRFFLAGLLLACLGPLPARAQQAAKRPWLGLSIERGATGVRVREVMPDSPCASADVHPGDEVLALDQTPLRTPSQLIEAVQAAGLGAKVTLRLLSPQGAERKIQVVLGPRPHLGEWQRAGLLGKPAPDVQPKVLSGPALPSLSGLRGEVVLLDFFASWCGPCMRSVPALNALAERLSPRGLRVIGISAEAEATIERTRREHRMAYTVAMDVGEQAARAYRIHAFPTLFVVDRKGVVRAVTNDLEEAEQAVLQALEKKGK